MRIPWDGLRPTPGPRHGFTLIEMMAVVLIIGMLSVLFGTVVIGRIEGARVTTASAAMTKIEQALEFYRLDNARYPTSEQGLEALVNEPTMDPLPRNYRPEGYLRERDLIDPWGEPFGYEYPGSNNTFSFDLWSYGADGQAGGEGPDRDIGNWSEGDGASE
ncbi:MAG: type II secretion system major pseudopilin GspG [Deltaproteobacteria bacterium]|nr:MAG: type II secretion system major pseudopilin GspG [Deltaproteobacteria bacterium]